MACVAERGGAFECRSWDNIGEGMMRIHREKNVMLLLCFKMKEKLFLYRNKCRVSPHNIFPSIDRVYHDYDPARKRQKRKQNTFVSNTNQEGSSSQRNGTSTEKREGIKMRL
eukprot:TRINITY_DN9277_c0_g1_i1.p1 TRINITY_DN9277_c0_g1~~TRINITY_DN9277_c0_g1_i1.p1  ORF type:complete len:112 (+),score=6.89 TRINITY_DN9277_c0_g1_i1:602-937(+)